VSVEDRDRAAAAYAAVSVEDRAAAYAKGEINRIAGLVLADQSTYADWKVDESHAVRWGEIFQAALASAFVIGYAAATVATGCAVSGEVIHVCKQAEAPGASGPGSDPRGFVVAECSCGWKSAPCHPSAYHWVVFVHRRAAQ
jgi:hypothetical protein